MDKSFTIRSLLVLAVMGTVIDGTARAACWYPDEVVAEQVKDFQYMLMVGALQCRNTGITGSEDYNAFVMRQRGVLDTEGYVLKGHFLRENGAASGRAAYDEYNTALSNRHAGRADAPSFCSTVAAYTRMASASSDRDFVILAESVIQPPASSCTASYALPPLVRRPEPVPPVAEATEGDAEDPYRGVPVMPAPMIEPAAVPAVAYAVPAYAPPAYAPAYAPPATVYAAPPAPMPPPVIVPTAAAPIAPVIRTAALLPTTMVAAAPIVPPQEPARASATDALQAAITALQAATDALKAQQAHPTN